MVSESDKFLLENLSFDSCSFENFGWEQEYSTEITVPSEEIPWADIMQQLELPVSGDEENDFNSILETIKEKIRNSPSKYDLNYYKWLAEHTYRVFMSLDKNSEEFNYSDFILDSEFEEFVNLAAS